MCACEAELGGLAVASLLAHSCQTNLSLAGQTLSCGERVWPARLD